jgi:hypothetical protein
VPHRRILLCRVGKNKNPKSPSKLLGQNEVKLMESCFAPPTSTIHWMCVILSSPQ